MHHLPPTDSRSRVDLWVLAMLVVLVAGGAVGLVLGRGCAPDVRDVPAKDPAAPPARHVS